MAQLLRSTSGRKASGLAAQCGECGRCDASRERCLGVVQLFCAFCTLTWSAWLAASTCCCARRQRGARVIEALLGILDRDPVGAQRLRDRAPVRVEGLQLCLVLLAVVVERPWFWHRLGPSRESRASQASRSCRPGSG
jgi:hypothetical protein